MRLKEYAVYKGEENLCIGTARECAEMLGVTAKYVYWLVTPTAKGRLASRKCPEKAITAVVLDDGSENEC